MAFLWERAQAQLLHRLPLGRAWFREVQQARWVRSELHLPDDAHITTVLHTVRHRADAELNDKALEILHLRERARRAERERDEARTALARVEALLQREFLDGEGVVLIAEVSAAIRGEQ
jgi:hypothetical protein